MKVFGNFDVRMRNSLTATSSSDALLLKLTRQNDADLRNEDGFDTNSGGACDGICKVEIWGKAREPPMKGSKRNLPDHQAMALSR